MATVVKRRKPVRKQTLGSPPDRLVVNDQIDIPSHFSSFEAFRLWCQSSDYPERGDVFWLGGTIWIGVAMEDLPTHNAVKTEVLFCLRGLIKPKKLGYVIADRMRLVDEATNLSVEPDLMYVSIESVNAGRVRLQRNDNNRILEVVGAPDMVLEVTSDSSVAKDSQLEDMYFAAGVVEYWLVDARGSEPSFAILRRGPKGFVATPRRNGRLRSAVFDRAFRLVSEPDLLGNPDYTLEVFA